ncbi:CHASE2 domain-containing protein [candidate division KSB1 bacterium]|nr:CHASE2 domain-containing protein [candidate division KSB1 bacterium]
MFRKLLNKLTDSFDTWLSGLLLSTLAAFWLLGETQMRDWRFKARYLVQEKQLTSDKLVIMAVTTKKANELTKVTPRFFLARLIDSVAQFKPRVIALDFEFLEDDRLDPHYADLQRAIAGARNVILPCLVDLHANKYRLWSMPPENLIPSRQIGYATLKSASDTKLQVRLTDKSLLPSFAFAAVIGSFFQNQYFADQEDLEELQKKTLDSLKITEGESLLPINYAGPIDAEDTTSLTIHDADKFLQRASNKEFWNNVIADKIVLIGSTLRQSDSSDQFETPYGTMFGVEVHANIINNLLTKNYLKSLGKAWTIFFTTVGLAIAALSLWRFRLRWAVAITAGWLLLYLIAGFTLFTTNKLILPLACPLKTGLKSQDHVAEKRGACQRFKTVTNGPG